MIDKDKQLADFVARVAANKEKRDQAFVKHDSGKPATHLLPAKGVLLAAEALGYGAIKYPLGNWKVCKDRMRYLGAALRHLLAILDDETTDPESGLPHAAHAAACLLIYADLEQRDAATSRIRVPGHQAVVQPSADSSRPAPDGDRQNRGELGRGDSPVEGEALGAGISSE